MSCLYFLPDRRSVTPGDLGDLDLASVIDHVQYRETMRGPGDVAGVLFCQSGTPPPRYDAESQVWSRRFGGTWIGIDPTRDHSPVGFQHAGQVTGKPLRLLDGNQWLIPQLRTFVDDAGETLIYLPGVDRVLSQNVDTGVMEYGDVIPQYADIYRQAVEIGDWMLRECCGNDNHTATIGVDAVSDFACNVLAVNYRLGKGEIAALGLLSESLRNEILKIATDWDGMRALLGNLQRRLGSGGTRTGNGDDAPTPAADTPTDQPLAK